MRKIIATSFAIALALAAAMAHAQQKKKYGAWLADTSDHEVQMAMTVNSTDASTGVLCTEMTGTCDAYIELNMKCEHGASYPMMINSAAGSFHLSTTCLHLGKAQFQLFVADDPKPMMSAFESGGEIGFAMPLESGQFRVIRFSTAGATAAINEVMEYSQRNRSKTDTNRRSDQTL